MYARFLNFPNSLVSMVLEFGRSGLFASARACWLEKIDEMEPEQLTNGKSTDEGVS